MESSHIYFVSAHLEKSVNAISAPIFAVISLLIYIYQVTSYGAPKLTLLIRLRAITDSTERHDILINQ